MKSLAKSILTEMALDFGDAPDWIDPEKKRKITQGQHPYADNPAFPAAKPPRRAGAPYRDDPNRPDPTRSYSELVTSHVYPEIIRKVQQYTGRNPRQMNPQQLMMVMMQAMQQAVRLEANHRPELEQAAVEIVLSLPEFRDAREAVQSGDLRIEAHLLDPQGMIQAMQQRIRGAENVHEIGHEEGEEEGEQMQVEPGEETPEERAELGLDVPEVATEYDAEAKKRRFINLMIQGAAINKNYAYHQIADQLRAIDPNILTTYGKLMSIAELMYWVMPEESLNQMMGAGQGGAGMEEINFEPTPVDTEREQFQEPAGYEGEEGDEAGGEAPEQPEREGVWVVKASAMVFPVLIQELAKGLYEFLSHNEDDPADVRKYAYNKGDTLGGEQWDIMKGPGVWRHFNHLVNQANASEYMGRIYRHLVTRPTGEFNALMQDILRETPRGRQYIQQLANSIRAEEEGRREESLAFRIIRRQE